MNRLCWFFVLLLNAIRLLVHEEIGVGELRPTLAGRELNAIDEVQRRFFKSAEGKRIQELLIKHNPVALQNCFFLDHIPDQGEDIYVLLVNGDELFKISIERSTDLMTLEQRELMPPQWQGAGTFNRRSQAILKLARQARASHCETGQEQQQYPDE